TVMNFRSETTERGIVVPLAEGDKVATVVKAVVRTAAAWRLTNAEAAALFDIPPATWSRMKDGNFKGRLDQDKVTRASLMIGIFKGLRLLFNGPLTYGWPKTPNAGSGFDGRTPVQVMCQGGIPAMTQVRLHIDALRGGV
ncbi:MAG: antitoxin Xre-like helix-turn-helix domain-containing protein, partial [Alphaproteobacteria bacterium]